VRFKEINIEEYRNFNEWELFWSNKSWDQYHVPR
jgi:hypothetical protein